MTTARKEKPCKVCRTKFVPTQPMQRVCSVPCAIDYAATQRTAADRRKAAAERKAIREAKAKAKTRGQWMREAQQAVNKYVRLRDQLANRPCVSCDRPPSWEGQWHASHFRSVGAASAVRFNLMNIHRACSICNHHLSGNIAGYRPRLIERIGQDKVEWIEQQNHLARYTTEYLERLKTVFSKKSNQLQKRIKRIQDGVL